MEKPIDFSDLETDLDTVETVDPSGMVRTGNFLEDSLHLAKQQPAMLKCPACRGTGNFYSNLSGRLVGECFRCKGTGQVTQRAEKARATRKANEEKREQAKSAWFIEHADVVRWIDDNLPRNSFAGSLHAQLEQGPLTERQVAAVRSNIQKDIQDGLDLSKLPEGRYAIPGGDSRLKVLIQRPTPPSKWAGFIFVSDAAEYGSRTKYGMQAPGKRYRGKLEEQLRVIAQDPTAASVAYGKLTGTCGVCGRHLEDKDSIERGIGPICYGKVFGG